MEGPLLYSTMSREMFGKYLVSGRKYARATFIAPLFARSGRPFIESRGDSCIVYASLFCVEGNGWMDG